MTFFESLLVLLLAAILLMQVSRRLLIPYPSMLALAGIAVGFLPGTPNIKIDPATMLALFIAPALIDAAYDFPVAAIKRLWRPLFSLAVVAVLLTTALVGWIGWALAGLPIAAAIALGAIVAPPDAAAATAVLRSASLPRRTMEVLKGESLLNDGTALLIFGCAVAIQTSGLTWATGARFALAIPGGILLGIVLARIYLPLVHYIRGTLGGGLLEFVNTFLLWILAEHLGLSAVLCVVAFAMTIARASGTAQTARVRVHSYAVWETVVFLLNVLAFLLMGMQARTIINDMPGTRLAEALAFAALVIFAVIALRMIWVLINNRLSIAFPVVRGALTPATTRQSILIGWCGMRGLVTLATAFALPMDFPQRDLIVLTAFGVVIATLVVQGMTVYPLMRLLRINDESAQQTELADTRRDLAEAGLKFLDGKTSAAATDVRHIFELDHANWSANSEVAEAKERRSLMLGALKAQRALLTELQQRNEISSDTYLILQEELDWKQLSLSTADEQTIEET